MISVTCLVADEKFLVESFVQEPETDFLFDWQVYLSLPMSVIQFAFCWLYILQYTGSEVNFDTVNLNNDCLLFLVSEVKSLALPSSLDQYSSQQHFDENQIIIPGLKVIRMSKCIGIQILPMIRAGK